MSLGIIALGILFVVLSTVITLVVYYVASGEWLWGKDDRGDGRNWPPPR